jgi:SAM-dependent methyltransferase
MDKLRPDGLFLEGGCGQAQWVSYFARRGYRVVGIDFAERTVARVKRAAPELDVRVGDITRLPFADGEVHSYYSGGVVEHAEGGPEAALREARRVIAPGGWFLCSVPDESALRRRLFRASRTERADLDPALAVARVERTVTETPPPGMEFFQYAFTQEEFTRRLEEAGFAVEATFGYGLVWGLMELPRFQALYRGAFAGARALKQRLRGGPAAGASAPSAAAAAESNGAAPAHARGLGGWLRQVLIKEDRGAFLAGPAIGLLCEYCSNMRMFVARPRA